MNPLEQLKQKKERLQREIDSVDNLLTAPLRYIEHVKRYGTALGKQYKLRKVNHAT